MESIKGLLFKDLLVFKGYKKNVIISIISFVVLILIASINYNMLTYGPLVFLLFFGMNSISTFSYDEADSTDTYMLALTVSKKDIIKAKYLFVLLDAFLSLFAGIIVTLLIYIILGNSFDKIGSAVNNWLLAFSSISFLMCSEIPCIYKWGVEKGRMQALLVPIIIVVMIGIIFTITVFMFPVLFQKKYLNLMIQNIPLICIVINIIMYLVSYFISYNVFRKKDL